MDELRQSGRIDSGSKLTRKHTHTQLLENSINNQFLDEMQHLFIPYKNIYQITLYANAHHHTTMVHGYQNLCFT